MESVIKADYIVPTSNSTSTKFANATLQKAVTTVCSHPVVPSTATALAIAATYANAIIVHAPTAAATITLPTAADMATRFSFSSVGDSVSFLYTNSNATSSTHQFVNGATTSTILPASATATSSSAAILTPTFVVNTTGTNGASDIRGYWLIY